MADDRTLPTSSHPASVNEKDPDFVRDTDTTPSTPFSDAETVADTVDFYPEGGRGWLVIFGCFIFCGVIVGRGYALFISPPSQFSDSHA